MQDSRVSPDSRKSRPQKSRPQKSIGELRVEIDHLDRAIAALERYADLTADPPAPARKPKRASGKAAGAGHH